MPTRASLLVPCLSLLLALSVSGEAQAAPSPDVDGEVGGEASASASVGGGGAGAGAAAGGGARRAAAMGGNRFRLHVDGEFFGFGHYNPDGGGDDDGDNMVGFGIGRGISASASGAASVAGTPMMGLGFGVVILGGNAVVGARAAMALGHNAPQDDNEARTTNFGGELLPYFRYMFLAGAIRPFVEGHFGFGGGLTKGIVTVDGEDYWAAGHGIAPIVGAAGGAMFFINEHVSIDLGLNFDYMSLHSRRTVSDNNPVQDDTDWSKDADLILMTINTGISGWF